MSLSQAYDLNRPFEDYSCRRQWLDQLLCASVFSYAFSPVSILALDDRRAPRPRWRPIPSAYPAVCSLYERLVRQSLASNTFNEAIKTVERMNFDVAFVQPEGKFVNVSAKMLLACVVVDADDPALENRKDALNTVRGDIVTDIFACAVIDRVVTEERADAGVCAGFIRMQSRARLDMLMDRGLDRFTVNASDRHGDGASAALAHSKNRHLTNSTAPRFEFFGLVLILFDATDKGFVDFYDALELGKIRTAAGFPQAVQNEPRRFLRDPYFLSELHGRDALAGRHKQVHRVNPFVQRNVAALEYRPGAHRKVFLALDALIKTVFTLPGRDPLAQAAHWATRTVGPQSGFDIDPRGLLIREPLEQLERRNSALGHGLSLNFWEKCSPKKRWSQVYNSP